MKNKLTSIFMNFCGFFHISSDSVMESFLQFVKFAIVGISNTLISYLTNAVVLLLLNSLDIKWDYVVGNIVSFILSVLWAFYWNNKFVFALKNGKKRDVGKALLKTYISYGITGIVLNNILSYIWINIFLISKFFAPIINLIISVPLNFIINKFWTFKSAG